MNKKTRTILYIVAFALFIIGAGMAYGYLSGRYKPQGQLPLNTGVQSSPEASIKNGQEAPATSPEGSPSQQEQEPLKALDFEVYDTDGKKVKLSDYEGTPIVLNFWASWCPPCKGEMPHFNKVSEEYSKDELIFLMVDMVDGQRETVETGKKFIEDSKYTFTVLYDTDQDAAVTYSIRSIPSTLFINKDGYVEAGVEGSIDEETLRRGIDMILP